MRGFTLIEILISISILALIAAISLPNIRKFGEDELIKAAASNLTQFLRKAQANAQTGVKCPNGEISQSWVVDFVPASVKADLLCMYIDDALSSITQSSLKFNDVSFDIFCNLNPATDKKLTLTSISVGESKITSACASGEVFTITLTSLRTAQTKSIKVDSGGVIYEE